jgi:Gas vesicle synthesis protein GvpL/GvpF
MATTASQTSVYVYGVTWADGAVARRGAGVAGADVDTLERGELAAIVSPVSDRFVRAKRRELMSHMEVLAKVFASCTVLPLRFGSVFPDPEAVVADLLGARYEELVELLHRFDGLAELRVRGAYREEALLAEIVADHPRIAAMRGVDAYRLQLGEAVADAVAIRRERDLHALAKALEPLAKDTVVEELRTEFELVRASYLVEGRDIRKFDRRMDEIAQGQQDRIAFTYAGPLPPHSFVALAGG